MIAAILQLHEQWHEMSTPSIISTHPMCLFLSLMVSSLFKVAVACLDVLILLFDRLMIAQKGFQNILTFLILSVSFTLRPETASVNQ